MSPGHTAFTMSGKWNNFALIKSKIARNTMTKNAENIEIKKTRTSHGYKFETKFSVTYPKTMYFRAKHVAQKMGVSIQDLQRMAMESYISQFEKSESGK